MERLLRYFCFLFEIVICTLLIMVLGKNAITVLCSALYMVEYLVIVWNLSFCESDSTILQFKRQLKNIDKELKHFVYSVDDKELFWFLVIYLYNTAWVSAYCCVYVADGSQWYRWLYTLLAASSEFGIATYTMMLYALCSRLAALVDRGATIDVAKQQAVYKQIVDLTEKFKDTYDFMFVVSLVGDVIGVMTAIYITIMNIKRNGFAMMWHNVYHLVNIQVVLKLLMSLVPAVVAEIMTKKDTALKVKLQDKLLFEKDTSTSAALQQFISYVRARPLRQTVYGLPLGADLLATVVQACVTYIIVVIQFTHLY